MKILWILSDNVVEGYSEREWRIREYRFDYFKKHWFEIVVLDIEFFDFSKKLFTKFKAQQNSKKFKIVEKEIIPDIIWIRTSKDRERYLSMFNWYIPYFPSQLVITLSSDKWYTYKVLSKFQPRTVLLNEYIVSDSLKKVFWKEIVVKPRTWYWWVWVKKYSSEFDLSELYANSTWEYIVQELCDFSTWYMWICDTNHDVRLTYIWGKLSYSELRTTDTWDFRVNVSQWWTAKPLNLEVIPNNLLDLSNKIIQTLGWASTWILSLDFWYENKKEKWILIEMNYSPWFTPKELESNIWPINRQFGDLVNYINITLK